MCTAVTYTTKDTYFGRTFDWEVSYGEQIAITPRNYPLHFRKMPTIERHYALIGMAVVVGDVPLYYDAINEKGLGMAGLNFPNNTDYKEFAEGKDNITPFEFPGSWDSVRVCRKPDSCYRGSIWSKSVSASSFHCRRCIGSLPIRRKRSLSSA